MIIVSNNNYTDPFYEEFDEKDVVNRGDYEPNDNQDDDTNKPLVPKTELIDVVAKGDILSVNNSRLIEEEEEFHGLIKKADVDSGKVSVANLSDSSSLSSDDLWLDEIDDNDDLIIDDELVLLNEDEEANDINIDSSSKLEQKIKNPNLTEEELNIGTDPDRENEEYLQKHFKDFLSLPKIAGKFSKSIENNLIPKDVVKKTGKTIEIADDLPQSKDTKMQSSVIINRDENGELESMEVICKCGERTLIKFEYLAPQDYEKGLTSIEDDQYVPIPFDELHQEKEEIVILNPDLVNIPNLFDENEKNSEKEEDIEDEYKDWDDFEDEEV